MPSAFSLRSVTADDCRRVWLWSNDDVTRAASFDDAAIPWDQHAVWFEQQLGDPDTSFWIATVDDAPVAQVRYAIAAHEATVSVSTDPAARRRGYATRTLRAGSERLFATTAVDVIHAYIKPSNDASRHLFLGAGYVDAGHASIRGHAASHLIQARIPIEPPR